LPPQLTYRLGNALYVPLTPYANTKTLPTCRGEGFCLPEAVVKTLLRIRSFETSNPIFLQAPSADRLPVMLPSISHLNLKPSHCSYSDQMFLEQMPQTEDGFKPSSGALLQEIIPMLSSDPSIETLVFAGEGEPTLRFVTLLTISKEISLSFSKAGKPMIPMRLITNGLLFGLIPNAAIDHQDCVRAIKKAGIGQLSVSLMTADPFQYDELMDPHLNVNTLAQHKAAIELTTNPDNFMPGLSHQLICTFIREALQQQLDVEITGVEHPEVDQIKAQTFIQSLGVTRPMRWRSYHPPLSS